MSSVIAATHGGGSSYPLDSTPDFSGHTIYFTARGQHGPAIFSVAAAGGRATEVKSGAPLVSPRGIAISLDGRTLYIADPGAGRIFALSLATRTLSAVRGSAGTVPQNLDVARINGRQLLYFTGTDPAGGKPAVLMLSPGATAPRVIASGSPLAAPDGLVVARSGTVYVADRAAGGNGLGAVLKIVGSSSSVVVNRMRLGNPAGITLYHDDSLLFVSALQPASGRAHVLVVDAQTLRTGSIMQLIGRNHSAGGLHRMPPSSTQFHGDFFSWANVTGGGRLSLAERASNGSRNTPERSDAATVPSSTGTIYAIHLH